MEYIENVYQLEAVYRRFNHLEPPTSNHAFAWAMAGLEWTLEQSAPIA